MPVVEFDNQVAIVTGAGGGIGRAIALELARRGARVLVNDVPDEGAAQGGSSTLAEATAREIRETGGTAAVSAVPVGSFEAARTIIEQARSAFGRIDMLANVAGTALPGEITAFDDTQVGAHFQTNLIGPYALVRAVWPVMRAQRYGRILNTSSNAAIGIGANAPYAATRAGMLGLTFDAAIEGREHGILVNAMMPAAYSRMIERIPDAAFVAWFREYLPATKVAAVAAYLLSRCCGIAGRTLAVGGGRVARVAFAEGRGWFDAQISAESVAEHIVQATNMASPRVLNTQPDAMALLSQALPTRAPQLDRAAVLGAGGSAAQNVQEGEA